MADKVIKVAVLEGNFAALCNLGLPLSVSLQLQEMGLELPDALWTVRSSSSGFSVSLFWPSKSDSVKKRKRKRKKRVKAKRIRTNVATQCLEPTESPEEYSKPLKSSDTSIDAHPPTRDESPSSSPSQSGSNTVDSKSQSPTSADELGDSIDLTSCCNVNFEMRDGCPGGIKILITWLQLLADGGKRKDSLILYCIGFLQTTLCERLTKTVAVNLMSLATIPTGANVRFDIYEGTPGLQI